jgi:hypothetical protein
MSRVYEIEIDKRREDLAVFSEPCPGLAGLIELGAPAEELKVVVDDHVDALRRRIEAATQVVPIRWLDHRSAVSAVRDRGIDILVNLNGYFGRARHHLFAARPAAVQVTDPGFPGTTGMPFIDYLIADEVVIPSDAHEHYTEKVVYLPDSYQPNDSQRQVAAHPATRTEAGLPQDAFVFCCMNNVYKIMPAVFDVWMRLLQRVPGSVLMLYSNTPETQDNLTTRRQRAGWILRASSLGGRCPTISTWRGCGCAICFWIPCPTTLTPPAAMRCGLACRCSPAWGKHFPAGWALACSGRSGCLSSSRNHWPITSRSPFGWPPSRLCLPPCARNWAPSCAARRCTTPRATPGISKPLTATWSSAPARACPRQRLPFPPRHKKNQRPCETLALHIAVT